MSLYLYFEFPFYFYLITPFLSSRPTIEKTVTESILISQPVRGTKATGKTARKMARAFITTPMGTSIQVLTFLHFWD